MPLRVRRADDRPVGSIFAVDHFYDSAVGRTRILIADPEVKLLRAVSGAWTPLSYRTPFTRVVTVDAEGALRLLHPADHERLVQLVDMWMVNVKSNLIRSGGLADEMRGTATYAAE